MLQLSLIFGMTTVVLSQVAPYDFSKFPECNFTGAIPVERSNITKLSRKFTVKVEGKKSPNSFFDSTGYYDADNDRGSTHVTSNGHEMDYLYDFVRGDAFSNQDGKCQKEAEGLYSSGCDPYAYFIAEVAAHHNISEQCSFFGGGLAYYGERPLNELVRGIQVRKWSQCVRDYSNNRTYVSHYFFSTEGSQTPTSGVVPVRFESYQLDAPTGSKNMSYVYDFTMYKPEVDDDSVFLPTEGSYCPGWTRETRTMPSLPDQFSMTLLTTHQHKQEIHTLKLNFDFKNKLVQYTTDLLNGTHFPQPPISLGKLYRVLHDYNTNMSFSIPMDAWIKSANKSDCIISTIPDDALEWSNSGSIHLMQASELFGMKDTNLIYYGERPFHDMNSSVWSTRQNNTDGTYTVTEYYWLQEEWSVGNNESQFVGFIQYKFFNNGTEIEQVHNQVTEYRTSPFVFGTFAMDPCLRSPGEIPAVFNLNIMGDRSEYGSILQLEAAIRNWMANVTATSPMRFADVDLEKQRSPAPSTLKFYVVEWHFDGIPTSWTRKTPETIFNDLSKNLGDKNKDIPLIWGGRRIATMTYLGNTLKKRDTSGDVTTTPSKPEPPQPLPIVSEGYSGSSMAGLAFAMIIIGAIGGLVAGFLLWKRNTGIAYQMYD